MVKKQEHKGKEMTELLKKIQADFENYKKRVEKERVDFTAHASQNLIEQLLPVLDSFDQALKNSENDAIKVIFIFN